MNRTLMCVLVALGVSCAGGACWADERALPASLWAQIVAAKKSMTWVDWESLRSIPAVRLALSAQEPGDVAKLPVVGDLVKAVLIAEPVGSSLVVEAWVDSGSHVWLRTDLERTDLERRFVEAGWMRDPDRDGIFAEPFDPVEDQKYMDSIAQGNRSLEEFQDDLNRAMIRRKWAAVLGAEGWLVVLRPYHRIGDVAAMRQVTDAEIEEALSFPFNGLLTGAGGALCVSAEDVVGNEGKEELEEAETAVEKLQAEYDELKEMPKTKVLDSVGDFLAVVFEVDGGIVIDLTMSMPSGESGKMTPMFVDAGIQVVGLMTAWASPNLARELSEAVVGVSADAVRLSVVLSQASLYEGTETVLARAEEIRRLEQRIEKLNAE